ncbi:hypothetical protein L226DRAFT_204913 [Lentinus tigrinus ALCF2SS1-7]|nr:hypothetical protein L226DRAFT_204913 [Lentinus tigrinus ALCF2SS1-7]
MDPHLNVWSRRAPTYLNVSEAAVANLSQTVNATLQQVVIGITYEGSYLKESLVDIVILTMFFGLFTVLTVVAAYVLFLKGIAQKATSLMLVAIIAMWVSTVAYWVATLLAAVETQTILRDMMTQMLVKVSHVQSCVGDASSGQLPLSACQAEGSLAEVSDYSKAYATQQCTGTAALTVNVIIGDAIVWWRAWVLWSDHRIVLYTWCTLILATMVTGIVDTKDACMPEATLFSITSPFAPGSEVLSIGSLFGADGWGIAAAILSLLTNMVATILIAYRAWEHRLFIMSHLKGCSTRSQVERTLALLVESGILYCALWVIIVVYQFVALKLGESAFAYGFYYVMGGCLIPLI